MKTLLSKSEDPYSALLAYHACRLENGYSPAELLMGRKFRTTVPMISKQLLPQLPRKFYCLKEEKIRKRQQDNFNNYHWARQLKPLQTGEHVYIPDNSSECTVTEESLTHSYVVQTPGGNYRRNHRHLLPLPPDYVFQNNNTTTENHTPTENFTPASLLPRTYQTRSVRVSKPPERLNLWREM